MSQCKLNACPPVGETMHSLGQCFCHLCTCGKHVCPLSLKSSKYHSSTLKSVYKKDYKRKPIVQSLKCLPSSSKYQAETRKDLISTSQHDFTPITPEKTSSTKYVRKNHFEVLKFSGLTNYKNDFPNWGNYDFINIGNFKKSYISSGVRLSPVTTYTQDFGRKAEAVRFKSQERAKSRNPMYSKGDFLGKTTSSQAFVNFGKDKFPIRVHNNPTGIVPMESHSGIYDTMYRVEYYRKESPIFMKKKHSVV